MLSCKQEGQNQVYNVLRQNGNNKALSLNFHFLLLTPHHLVPRPPSAFIAIIVIIPITFTTKKEKTTLSFVFYDFT